MLATQTLLHEQGLAGLEALGIEWSDHPYLPLSVFNYSQINSPKTHPVVHECRGLVLERGSWELVAKPFDRFFNLGEALELQNGFDYSNCYATDKEDGSLIVVYNYGGGWHVNTRGSFGYGLFDGQNFSWRDLFITAFGDLNRLDSDLTYVFELCSPYNKIVRHYPKPTAFLLSVFNGPYELSPYSVGEIAADLGVRTPLTYQLRSPEEAQRHVLECSQLDQTYEGVVLADYSCHPTRRIKVKSAKYIALHAMRGNNNMFLPKYLLPYCLSDDPAELLLFFPEVADKLSEVKNRVDKLWAEVKMLWNAYHGLESQRDFAEAVKHHPLSSVLFNARKGADLWHAFTQADKGILRCIES